jgi:hypothetical protein
VDHNALPLTGLRGCFTQEPDNGSRIEASPTHPVGQAEVVYLGMTPLLSNLARRLHKQPRTSPGLGQ